mmetsp:Transcript_20866/g.29159  ORF Transcript_20866/g.29159 Transcript_20866/m.29159 type:complete len:81 (-) Transcript_20866:67-309(-)
MSSGIGNVIGISPPLLRSGEVFLLCSATLLTKALLQTGGNFFHRSCLGVLQSSVVLTLVSSLEHKCEVLNVSQMSHTASI